MTDFMNEYKDFLVGLKEKSLLRLEQKKKYEYTDLTLFLLSLKTASDGFVESFCLDDNTKERLEKIRTRRDNDPLWEATIISELENFLLPMTSKKFMSLSLDNQLDIIKGIKLKLEDYKKESFDNKFGDLVTKKEDLKGSCYVNYRTLVGNAFYAKQTKYLEYDYITEFKRILYHKLNEEYRYIMFENGDYDFIEIKIIYLLKNMMVLDF